MPSMHLTWALLIAINARSLRLRIGLWIYAAAMVVATLALREHYLIDLIAAVPYTLGVQWAARRWERYQPVLKRTLSQSG
jgi:membrane-associated phospholipid phosphatase